jgi:alpha-amylase/alpha-mannosidase (GH57 family)
MKPPLKLALIWHFHQPDYTDPATGRPGMPWTRLHALKDYLDMAAHLRRHPAIRATFNVVPTLLEQLERLAGPDPVPDRFLELAMKRAEDLTDDERRFVTGQFFSLHLPTMAADLRRLVELRARHADAFDAAALRDLQVLFHLAWSGPTLRADPVLARLVEKGRGFDEDDKAQLFARQAAFVREVLPAWRDLAATGRVEFGVSPYFHAILPLLCDLDSAREALPDLALPAAAFRHPEDARVQLALGLAAFERTFGRPAAGGWPSEGAISEEALRQMGTAGYRWAASDEDVLFASLGEGGRLDRLLRPWRFPGGPVLLFREHDLSDRIGFVYATYDPEDAARDFVGRLLQLRDAAPEGVADPVVTIVLDGENAWERYPRHGLPFFDALYGAIAAEPGIRTVTASEAANPDAASPLPRVVAGSWIYRNLATWIGHPEKNRAWELLAAARSAVASVRRQPSLDDDAWRALLAAEGSDWFWWFGDDHPTPNADEFDALFRGKLAAAYRAIGRNVPDAVREPVRRGEVRSYSGPTGTVRPTLDGRVTDYFEWLAAGRVEAVYGAMQAAARLVRQVLYGGDGQHLFLRIDPFEPGALDRASVRLEIAEREPLEAGAAGRSVLDRILEIEVPLAGLLPDRGPLRFAVVVEGATGAHQRIPADGFAELSPGDDPGRFDWSA